VIRSSCSLSCAALLIACEAAPLPPLVVERSAAPSPSIPAPAPPPSASATAVASGLDPRFSKDFTEEEQQRVLRASFPKFLRGACPPDDRAKNAGTWGRLSELQEEAYRRGLFKPRLVQRITGCFTAKESEETLYLIAVNACVQSDFQDDLLVVFRSAELATKSPHPFVRIESTRVATRPSAFVAIERREGVDFLLREPEEGVLGALEPEKVWVRVEATPGQGRLH